MTEKIVPSNISKYKSKSKEEIFGMFDEDIDNNILRPTDYKRIMYDMLLALLKSTVYRIIGDVFDILK